jgi:hypothetical protein
LEECVWANPKYSRLRQNNGAEFSMCPPHRGSLSNTTFSLSLQCPPLSRFQSPPHRGSLSNMQMHQSAYQCQYLVSIPSTSGKSFELLPSTASANMDVCSVSIPSTSGKSFELGRELPLICLAWDVSIPSTSGKSFEHSQAGAYPSLADNQFQSPPHRGSLSNRMLMFLLLVLAARAKFQSPPHRGSLSNGVIIVVVSIVKHSTFQSPPHRGSLSNPACQNYFRIKSL